MARWDPWYGGDKILNIMRILLITLCKILIIVVSVLIGLAYLTLLERKILGSMHLRLGPQVVGV